MVAGLLAALSAAAFFLAGYPVPAGVAMLVFTATLRLEERGPATWLAEAILLSSPIAYLVRAYVVAVGAGAWLFPGVAVIVSGATISLLRVEEAMVGARFKIYVPRPIAFSASREFRFLLLSAFSMLAYFKASLLFLAILLFFGLTVISMAAPRLSTRS